MTVRGASAAAATQPGVAAAATALLARGNAVDAVCAGVLAASALEPGVLLGPVHFLVAGPGLGVRCVDGRPRQPGRGAPRPRGFITTAEVPAAARVAVPALPAAIATALSMFGGSPLRAVSEPALDLLERSHPRRSTLASLAREGAAWMAKEASAEALTAHAGRLAGGLVTRDDLRFVRASALECAERDGVAFAPMDDSDAPAGRCHVVCAADCKGGVAAACYEIADQGVVVDALGLLAPLLAKPVMRGERRTEPGVALPCASTIALVDVGGKSRFDAAIGFGGQRLPAAVFSKRPLDALLRAHAPAVGTVRGKRAVAYSFTP